MAPRLIVAHCGGRWQVDPEGDRTIGVLTKPDLINPGGEEEVREGHRTSDCKAGQARATAVVLRYSCWDWLLLLQVLAVVQNVRKPLKLGYIMVKNRNQHQLNQHMTLREAQHDELDFFKSHPYFSEVPESQLVRVWCMIDCLAEPYVVETNRLVLAETDVVGRSRLSCGQGVGSLARKLTRVLVTRIQSSLPYMKHELLEKLERTGKEVEALGDPAPAELSQCRSAVMQLITR